MRTKTIFSPRFIWSDFIEFDFESGKVSTTGRVTETMDAEMRPFFAAIDNIIHEQLREESEGEEIQR